MFDVGWTELVVIACVAIIVVGPKDLPKMLRAFGKTVGGLRRMAGEFQKQFDDALKEAELDEVKNLATKKFQPLEDVRKSALEYQNKVKAELNGAQNEINAAAAGNEAEQASSAAVLPEPAAPADNPAGSPAGGPAVSGKAPVAQAPDNAMAEKKRSPRKAKTEPAGKSAAGGSK